MVIETIKLIESLAVRFEHKIMNNNNFIDFLYAPYFISDFFV